MYGQISVAGTLYQATLPLHGEADQNVSIASGKKPIELARSVGAEAEFVPYPGKPYGFDFSDTDPMTADAIDRVSQFFQARLPADHTLDQSST